MKRYHLIDTENIGDRWIDLIKSLKKKEILVIFYTKNHSHLLEKTYLELRYHKQLRWVECVTGNSALDYQLIGVLSYLITMHPNAEYLIHSNDNDYQNAINFWKKKGKKIERVKFDTKKKKKKSKRKKAAPTVQIPDKLTEETVITEIAKAIPVSNLNGWYRMLCAFLGQDLGKNCYAQLKKDTERKEGLAKNLLPDKREQKIYLIALLYKQNQLDDSKAEEAFNIINEQNHENKKEIKTDFGKHFGNKTSEQVQYYRVIKNVVEVLKEREA